MQGEKGVLMGRPVTIICKCMQMATSHTCSQGSNSSSSSSSSKVSQSALARLSFFTSVGCTSGVGPVYIDVAAQGSFVCLGLNV